MSKFLVHFILAISFLTFVGCYNDCPSLEIYQEYRTNVVLDFEIDRNIVENFNAYGIVEPNEVKDDLSSWGNSIKLPLSYDGKSVFVVQGEYYDNSTQDTVAFQDTLTFEYELTSGFDEDCEEYYMIFDGMRNYEYTGEAIDCENKFCQAR